MDFITEFLSRTLGSRVAVLILSAVPFFELKGAIVLGRALSLGFFETLLLSFIGSFSVFFILYFLFKPLLAFFKKLKPIAKVSLAVDGYCASVVENRLLKNKSQINRATVSSKFTALLIFVAIPAPMTGVWTGTLVAVYTGLSFKSSALAIGVGNLVAGIIISVLAELFTPYLNIILAGILLIVMVAITVFVIKIITFSRNGKVVD